MGAVFAARDELLQRDVALKLLSQEQASIPEAMSRFLNEARAAAQLESEHAARILDMGRTESGTPFLALELLAGADLEHIIAEWRRLPIADVVGWVVQALDAVAEAHALGFVHRDLKPANLFLARRRDGTQIVKVLDFGISKNLGASGAAPTLTATATMLGSPAYMAPEQLRNAKTVDARADVWSLGVALYELLTGQMPFRAESIAEICVAILEHTPISMRALRSDIPASLEQVVLRCLARNPEERFPNVGELARALAPFGPPGIEATVERVERVLRVAESATGKGRTANRRRSILRWIAGALAVGAVVVVASLVSYEHAHGSLPAEHRAPPPAAHAVVVR